MLDDETLTNIIVNTNNLKDVEKLCSVSQRMKKMCKNNKAVIRHMTILRLIDRVNLKFFPTEQADRLRHDRNELLFSAPLDTSAIVKFKLPKKYNNLLKKTNNLFSNQRYDSMQLIYIPPGNTLYENIPSDLYIIRFECTNETTGAYDNCINAEVTFDELYDFLNNTLDLQTFYNVNNYILHG